MSQPDAAFCIQAPMFDSTVAIQRMVKALRRNGLQADVALGDLPEDADGPAAWVMDPIIARTRQKAKQLHPSAPQNALRSAIGTGLCRWAA